MSQTSPQKKVAFHLNLSDPPCHHHGWRLGSLVVPWLGTPNAAWFQTLWALMQPWQHAIRASNGHLWWCTMVVEMWTNREKGLLKGSKLIYRWCFRYFLFSPKKLGKRCSLTSIFFKWVGLNHQLVIHVFLLGLQKVAYFQRAKVAVGFKLLLVPWTVKPLLRFGIWTPNIYYLKHLFLRMCLGMSRLDTTDLFLFSHQIDRFLFFSPVWALTEGFGLSIAEGFAGAFLGLVFFSRVKWVKVVHVSV